MGRILQFSDVHFGCEHEHACAAALDYAHATPNDLVLITGDITQKGLPGEFAAAGEWMRAMPEPRFVIVGNHDVPYWDAFARVFSPWKAFETATGFPAHDGQFCNDTVMVRGVVTARGWQARPNWSKGVIDLMLKYAVSEDGALHAEKYFQTAVEEFAPMRPAFRWRQLVTLARVTASDYADPAPGRDAAPQLLPR